MFFFTPGFVQIVTLSECTCEGITNCFGSSSSEMANLFLSSGGKYGKGFKEIPALISWLGKNGEKSEYCLNYFANYKILV